MERTPQSQVRVAPHAADALADELLIAIRDHPGIAEHRLMDPAYGQPHRALCEAYNRLYCELHDRVAEPSQEWLDAQNDPGHPLYGKSWTEAVGVSPGRKT